MSKFERVLSDDQTILDIAANCELFLPYEDIESDLVLFARRIEQAAIAAFEVLLAGQKPVAWTAKAMLGERYFNGDLSIEAFCSKEALLDEYSAAEPVPLYAHPMPSSQGFLDNSSYIPDASKMIVPDGWQLVPKTPTHNMVDNAHNCDSYFEVQDIYKAMLAAAPKYTEDKK